MKSLVIFLFLPALAFSQADSCDLDTTTHFYPDGSIKIQFTVKDNKSVGTYTEYYSNGVISQRIIYADRGCTFRNKEGIDTTYYYYPSGKLQKVESMKNENPIRSISYYESGSIKLISEFDEDGVLKNTEVFQDKK